MKKQHILLFFLLLFCSIGFAQSNGAKVEIIDAEVLENRKTIKLYIKAVDENGNSIVTTKSGNVKITDRKTSNNKRPDTLGIRPGSMKKIGKDNFRILYLLDQSGSMYYQGKFEAAKAAIRFSLEEHNIPEGAAYFSNFHDSTFAITPISLNDYDEKVGELKVTEKDLGNDTDLFYAIKKSINEWKDYSGRKVIMLLTDGRNDIYGSDKILNDAYNTNVRGAAARTPVTRDEILNLAASLDPSFSISTIGFGNKADTTFLQELVDSTANTRDEYSFAETPDQFNDVVGGSTKSETYNFTVEAVPNELCVYTGQNRELKVAIKYRDEWITGKWDYAHGDPFEEIPLCRNVIGESGKSTLKLETPLLILIGVLFIGFLLFGLVALVPSFKKRSFKSKFVKKYKQIKTSGRVKSDLLTGLPFSDEDMVVTKCQHWAKLSSWEANNHRCIEYGRTPGCADGYADYHVKTGFFKQAGINKRLNWLWFGALGGFLGWCFLTALKLLDMTMLNDALSGFIDEGYVNTFSQMILKGAGMGFAIALTLSLVEEFGQSRSSGRWGRIILRSFIGLIIGIIIFFLINFLNRIFLESFADFGNMISWLLFGTFMALVLTINSTIRFTSALKGGLLAALIGYAVFWVLTTFSPDPQIGQLLAFICYGLVLGVVLNTVINRLEDFELEYLKPEHIRRVNPISKWLKGNAVPKLFIGTESGCYVNVKWEDPAVKEKHAYFTYENGQVFITPMAETLIDERPIDKKTMLKNGALIRLGQSSVTQMRFNAKEQSSQNKATNKKQKQAPPKNKPGAPPPPPGNKNAGQASKQKIKIGTIRRRN